jgi:hypothetical protein
MEIPCDKSNHDLFNSSTIVTIGNEKIASFWTPTWINGTSAKAIAPCYIKRFGGKKSQFKKLWNTIDGLAIYTPKILKVRSQIL